MQFSQCRPTMRAFLAMREQRSVNQAWSMHGGLLFVSREQQCTNCANRERQGGGSHDAGAVEKRRQMTAKTVRTFARAAILLPDCDAKTGYSRSTSSLSDVPVVL